MINYLFNKEVIIPIESLQLNGALIIPDSATGLVVFSHGSGSSRHSPRNKFVARKLQEEGFATLLFDLLTYEEDLNYSNRFDIELLIQRLILVTNWLKEEERTKDLKIGYFGASTGAASALGAASMLGEIIKTVVSRGGRPDLAMPYLPEVKSSTLFIVGSQDIPVIKLNEEAFDHLGCKNKRMVIIEGATHLFEEARKLEEVSQYAGKWFQEYLK
jgi:pimeloyl-ACP methyl ester carboxylesterase